MDKASYETRILNEIQETVSKVDPREMEEIVARIVKGKRIFVAGAGRTLLVMRAFAMRLMHIGLTAFVVGDTVTPAISAGDLLLIGSGTGETEGLVMKAFKAKKIGTEMIALTIFPNSSIAKCADAVLIIPGATDKVKEQAKKSIQPGANLFEQSLLIVLDAAVMRIADEIGFDISRASDLHANLE